MNVLNWIKANPLIVGCAAVIVLATVSFYWPTHRGGAALRERVAEREALLSRIDSLRNTQVVLPPGRPDDPPGEVRMVANQAAIDALENLYRQLESEYIEIYDAAAEYNQRGHEVMLEDLFPEPVDVAQRYDAREAYTRSFTDLYAMLNASGPPDDEQVAMILEHEEEAVRRANHLGRDGALSDRQREELERRQAEKLIQLYRAHARRLHVYAEPTEFDDREGIWDPGIFDVGSWAQSAPAPEMFDIWEGQMGLWVQQDLVMAVRDANRVNDPTVSLLDMPIKRVRSMSVERGYIGRGGGYFADLRQGDAQGGRSAAYDARISEIQEMLDSRLPDDFTVSGTGRATNPIYDVRHAELRLLVDSQQIPAVLQAIEGVNLMTVVGANVSNVDEYEALRDGYYYGTADVVELDLKIETIWLRSWTAGHLTPEVAEERGERFNPGLMPDSVRAHLGLPPRSDSFDHSQQRSGPGRDTGRTPAGQQGYGPGPGGPGADYGQMMQQQMQQMQQQRQQQQQQR